VGKFLNTQFNNTLHNTNNTFYIEEQIIGSENINIAVLPYTNKLGNTTTVMNARKNPVTYLNYNMDNSALNMCTFINCNITTDKVVKVN
jgi:hypothetical protein